MSNLLILAWRNLWRNRRRTIITTASVFFALFFAYLMRGFQLGSYDNMVNNLVHSYSGFVQIHGKNYWEEKILDNGMHYNARLAKLIRETPGVSGFSLRLETFVLASAGTQTKGAILTGIIPSSEDSLMGISKKIIAGKYLDQGDQSALLGSKLAKYLGLEVGDTLVILGMGYHGSTAAGTFPVKGILRFPVPQLDAQSVFIGLESCQALLSADSMLTSVAINLSDADKVDEVKTLFQGKLDSGKFEVMSWQEMMPELVQQIKADNAEGLIMLGILYVIIAFGVLGTVLMMVNERKREFGMMVAVGMQKTRLLAVFLIEMLFIGLIGVVSGLIFSIPIIYYYYLHPYQLTGEMARGIEQFGWEAVMPVAWEPSYFIGQSLVVFLIFGIVMIFPTVTILRLRVINAIKR